MKRVNRLVCFFCTVVLLMVNLRGMKVYADEGGYSADDILDVCEEIIEWASSDGDFFTDNLVSTAGSSASDWLFIGYCRLYGGLGSERYLTALSEYVTEMYEGNLENTKATEWQRVGLAVLSAGGDPFSFGVDVDGNAVDLVAEGTYDHAKYSSLGRQGINGWCFALILMDACEAEVPEGASYTRENIIEEILTAQLENGGFSLTGATDPDVTSIAIQALSNYYDDETAYTLESDGETVSRTVGEAVDLALSWLSDAQLEDGDFSSYGTANAESTVQVLLALTCLGIDPQEDERFIKDGNTVIDGLLRYRLDDGGFAHSLDDEGNATGANGLASAQSLCGLVAYYRSLTGMSGFYEFTEDERYVAEIVDTEEDVSESEAENEQTEYETDSQTDDENDIYDGETSETVSEASDDEDGLPANFVYIIAGIIICIGIISLVVMRKIGIEDDKNRSE